MSNLAPALRDTGPQPPTLNTGAGNRAARMAPSNIVATGHNNLAINHSVSQVARHFIRGNEMKEGMLNRVSAVVRAYDPCLSCSTHAGGTPALEIALKGPVPVTPHIRISRSMSGGRLALVSGSPRPNTPNAKQHGTADFTPSVWRASRASTLYGPRSF